MYWLSTQRFYRIKEKLKNLVNIVWVFQNDSLKFNAQSSIGNCFLARKGYRLFFTVLEVLNVICPTSLPVDCVSSTGLYLKYYSASF